MSPDGRGGMRGRRGPVVAVVVAVVVVTSTLLVVARRSDDSATPEPIGSGAPASDPAVEAPSRCVPEEPEALDVTVEATLVHSSDAYTQGLVVYGGELFESTGRRGESTLRVLDPDSGAERRRVDLPDEVFGEGLAVGRDGELVQLTWKDQIAFRWERDELRRLGEFEYDGEGWGLTTLDDGTLVMSDGSDQLTERDPTDFEILRRRQVTRTDGAADQLNELEWDGTHLWANRYRSDELLRIDPECATVTGVADLGPLRAGATEVAERSGDPIDVTNGIAHVPDSDSYLLTGKLWPTMYRVRIGPG